MAETHMGSPEDPVSAGHRSEPFWGRRLGAFSVHVFTASGAALGFLALIAAVRGQWPLMFAWLGLALLVDGVDGAMARRLHVAERLPRWSGDTLDLIVDFVTYVFVPAYAIAASGLLPTLLAIPAGLAIVVSSALYFADKRMKTADNYFWGFPALWNAAAFYLLLLRPGPWITTAVIGALVVTTFIPLPFVHPLRVRKLRALSIMLLIVWSALASVALLRGLEPGVLITAGLTAIGLYFLCIGLLRGSIRQ